MMKRPLHKTTIVIWSSKDPTKKYDLAEIACKVTNGQMYCASMTVKLVEDPRSNPDWGDGTRFFENLEAAQARVRKARNKRRSEARKARRKAAGPPPELSMAEEMIEDSFG